MVLAPPNLTIKYEIKTGLTGAFIINIETTDTLITKDPKSADIIIRHALRGIDT